MPSGLDSHPDLSRDSHAPEAPRSREIEGAILLNTPRPEAILLLAVPIHIALTLGFSPNRQALAGSYHIHSVEEAPCGDGLCYEGTLFLQQQHRLQPLRSAVSHDPAAVTGAEGESALGSQAPQLSTRSMDSQGTLPLPHSGAAQGKVKPLTEPQITVPCVHTKWDPHGQTYDSS